MPVVAAVGLALPSRSGQSVRISAAVQKELRDALQEGVTNPNVLKARMRVAYRRIEKELRGGSD
jgi:hypothetical protein